MIDLADALREAHRKGFVHRDVKPQNVLVDQNERVYLVDFGLALADQDVGKRLPAGGTPAYMSPEQAKGEGHRVDGRSDIFSLGVMFYELLTGRRPFSGETHLELFEQITELDPKPIRQWDDSVDLELERICLKMLAKRKSDRFSSAKELIDDLRVFLAQSETSASNDSQLRTPVQKLGQPSAETKNSVDGETPHAVTCTSGSKSLRIVPKGLRSFDQHDSDFFLELLPGPRDRNGIPDTIGFWKTRVEERDSDKTFTVGLVYGPSGCGKSSMMKAGLLPRLSSDVLTFYLEATSDRTESTLLAMLRKRLDVEKLRYDKSWNLVELVSSIRRGFVLPANRKVLLVIDQFEQWLCAHTRSTGTELLDALLQCDGSRLQSIVMVRDDFWMAATRFFRDLDIPLVERYNSAGVDLFDIDHSERVLKAFGRAFGKLDAQDRDERADRKQFISESVRGLADENKVISVRLSLFAEMMKGRPWTLESLNAVGGTRGVGATFLEETFSASEAPPAHRYHQIAARAVLRSLLPSGGTEIKGHRRSRIELLEASGYGSRDRDFADLMRILDSELRLITPVDVVEPQSLAAIPHGLLETQSRLAPAVQYQLTHDYLVPSLRDWLTRKQRETRRGRAELKLDERAAAWIAKREPKQLPTLAEWFGISRLTDRKHWTESQQLMMGSASRMHMTHVGLAAMLILAITGIGLTTKSYIDRQRESLIAKNRIEKLEAEASSRVDGLLKTDSLSLVSTVDGLKEYREWAQDDLEIAFKSSAEDSNAKLHAGLGLLSFKASPEPALVDYLKERLLTVSPTQLAPVRTLLESHRTELIPAYWEIARNDKQSAIRRFHAASALAGFDPSNAAWDESTFAMFVSEQLVAVSPTYVSQYQELVRPVSAKLIPALTLIFKDLSRGEIAHTMATSLLADYAAQDPATLVDLVIMADAPSDRALFPVLKKHLDVAVKRFESILDRSAKPNWHDGPLDKNWVEPDAMILASIESAHGIIGERFAYVVDMPMDKFIDVAEKLRTNGYRPTRVRAWNPEPPASAAQISAIWRRDNKRWHLEFKMDKSALPAIDKNAEKDGLLLDDICVVPSTEETSDPSCIVLWSEPTSEKEQRRVVVDATEQEIIAMNAQFAEKGIPSQRTVSVRTNSKGERLYTGIWSNEGARSELRPAYAGFELVHQPQWDVAVSPAGRLPDPLDRFRKQLASFEKPSVEKFDDPKLRELRATANYSIGNLDAALSDFDILIEKDKNSATILQYRTLTLARLGKADEANASLDKYLATNAQASLKTYLQIQLPAWLGDYDKAWEQLQAAATTSAPSESDLYNVACAGALCSKAFQPKDAEKSKKFADRTFELLDQLIKQGYRNATKLRADPDFASLHSDPRFVLFLEQIDPAPRFAALWQADVPFESRLITFDLTKESRQSIQQLLSQGFRPQAIAPDSSFKLLFHLPIIPDEEKESLAIEQAAAATALLRLGTAERVWPLLQDQPDPRMRSYLLHRLASYRVDPQSLFNQLTSESDVSRQRTLILGLGEFARAKLLSSEQRASLLSDLIRRYSNDPDSGIHGAAEWTLRQLDAMDEISKVKAAYSTGMPIGDRNWYVTKTGADTNTCHALVIIQPPDEFKMGSPTQEADRSSGSIESQHRRSIGRTFAIGEHEVTLAQFKAFRAQHSFDLKGKQTHDSPVIGITWNEVANYCNWLSEQEGIPQDQWCYGPSQKTREDTVSYPDLLQRTGYRLPTEAEWEYACRAGAATARCFGQTEKLLGEYAWYKNKLGNDTLMPVGSLRPNCLGLFDMHGNAQECCQGNAVPYDLGVKIVADKPQTSSGGRMFRGGSFLHEAVSLRSAHRGAVFFQSQAQGLNATGFRLARTFK